MYTLAHLLLFAILAVVAGANSYRGVHSFIDVHLDRLKAAFGLGRRRAPAYTLIRLVLQSLDASELERVFRIHAAVLADRIGCDGVRVVAFDGKTLRGSFDHFADRAAIHLVSAFDATAAMILGHIEVGEKENPAVPMSVRLFPPEDYLCGLRRTISWSCHPRQTNNLTSPAALSPELTPRPKRRMYSAKEKLRILDEAVGHEQGDG